MQQMYQLCRMFIVDLTPGVNTHVEIYEGTIYQSATESFTIMTTR